ncbi:Crp/Fnr family transcriptional regulator [Paucibacter soli]|uniref:Crp/Fnr family transcriptional regulator n=1 Tax=Paucibacter soli TaxID=3133433 RepID=UPI003095D537
MTCPVSPSPPQALRIELLACIAALSAPGATIEARAFEPLLAQMQLRDLQAGETLLRVGDHGEREVMVLRGCLRSWVGDREGRSVTLGFHVGPCALPPAITRHAEGRSRIQCDALGPARVASFGAEALSRLMRSEPCVGAWGDHILRGELLRRAEREWALAALPARERLLQFRAQFPGLEAQVAQHHIASYLGITPVSLSRLRAQLKG